MYVISPHFLTSPFLSPFPSLHPHTSVTDPNNTQGSTRYVWVSLRLALSVCESASFVASLSRSLSLVNMSFCRLYTYRILRLSQRVSDFLYPRTPSTAECWRLFLGTSSTISSPCATSSSTTLACSYTMSSALASFQGKDRRG